jgi:hypothetical protein
LLLAPTPKAIQSRMGHSSINVTLDHAERAVVVDGRVGDVGGALRPRGGGGGGVVAVGAAPSFRSGIGSHLALHASAMGKVLLSAAELDVAAEVASLGPLEAFTDRTVVSASELVTEVLAVRTAGWAVNRQERYDAVVGVAASPYRRALCTRAQHGIANRLRSSMCEAADVTMRESSR